MVQHRFSSHCCILTSWTNIKACAEYVLRCITYMYLATYSIIVFLFLFLLQGARVLSLYAGYFSHPDLTRLASVLPLCALRKRVDSTTDRYSSAFEKSIGLAASSYNEISFVLNYLVSTFLNQELLLLVQALRGYFSRWCYDKSKNTYFKGNLITFVSVSKSLQLRLSFFIFKVTVISTCQ